MSENTQTSIDVLKDIEHLFLVTEESVESGSPTDPNRTRYRNQNQTNLCHSFAVVSCLRQALIKMLTTETPFLYLEDYLHF